MCDTMVAGPKATKSGGLLFAKNSDRGANEAQYLDFRPRATHAPGATLRCTYIEIPQVAETHAVLLSRPFWMWGAEMGANEHGLVIGNEAVFAKIAPQKEQALLGMDLLRLGLERAKTAAEALDVITALLGRHGQGGNCAPLGKFEYHNSFLIADTGGAAYVLETVGREWAVERVDGFRSISNTYTISAKFDATSENLIRQAIRRGFAKEGAAFDFAVAYADRLRSTLGHGVKRWCRTTDLLGTSKGHTPQSLMAILRDHGEEAARNSDWRPDGIMGGGVCAHASWGPIRQYGQTTASWVADLTPGRAVHWVTGTSSPDTSIFKPVFFGPGFEGAALPDFGPAPTDRFDPATLWWRHERLHRAVLEDYAPRLAAFAGERDRLEAGFFERVDALLARGGRAEEAAQLSRDIWAEAAEAEERWLALVLAMPKRKGKGGSLLYRMHWRGLAKLAGIPG